MCGDHFLYSRDLYTRSSSEKLDACHYWGLKGLYPHPPEGGAQEIPRGGVPKEKLYEIKLEFPVGLRWCEHFLKQNNTSDYHTNVGK